MAMSIELEKVKVIGLRYLLLTQDVERMPYALC